MIEAARASRGLAFATLPVVQLVTVGRTGSGFLHSMIDGHPKVAMLPMELKFHEMWQTLNCDEITTPSAMAERWFTGSKLRWFISGPPHNVGIPDGALSQCDIDIFRNRFMELLEGNGIDRRVVFLAMHQAYVEATGQDPAAITVVFEFPGSPEHLDKALNDFPGVRFIQVVRDLRGNYASIKQQYLKSRGGLFNKTPKDGYISALVEIFQTLTERTLAANNLARIVGTDRWLIVRQDELHLEHDATVRAVAAWIGIDDHETLRHSTVCGRSWLGNSATGQPITGVDSTVLTRWREQLNSSDIQMVDHLFGAEQARHGYGIDSAPLQGSVLRQVWTLRRPVTDELFFTPLNDTPQSRIARKLDAWLPGSARILRNTRNLALTPLLWWFYLSVRLWIARLAPGNHGLGLRPNGKHE